MRISREEGIELIAALWADEHPLVRKYFGTNLAKLLRATQTGVCDAHFAKIALWPDALEARLHRIEGIGQTDKVMSEVGAIDDSEKLVARLKDAWAELRLIDQLRKEGFNSIEKVEVTADLKACREEQATAFQVTRINKSWHEQVSNHSEPGTSAGHIAYGNIGEIYKRLSRQLHQQLVPADDSDASDDYGPLSYYFWDAIHDKNSDLKNWDETDYTRCLVIVSDKAHLQDPLVRHIACRLIREALHNWLQQVHFEELLWLPDTGNGAWFKIGATIEETRCFADWSDKIGSDPNTVHRREVDLDSVLPNWRT